MSCHQNNLKYVLLLPLLPPLRVVKPLANFRYAKHTVSMISAPHYITVELFRSEDQRSIINQGVGQGLPLMVTGGVALEVANAMTHNNIQPPKVPQTARALQSLATRTAAQKRDWHPVSAQRFRGLTGELTTRGTRACGGSHTMPNHSPPHPSSPPCTATT
jgi:hypothetical protein